MIISFYGQGFSDTLKQAALLTKGVLSYLKETNLRVIKLGRGVTWLETGTLDTLLQARNFIRSIIERQSQQVGCIEEVAFEEGFIGKEQLLNRRKLMRKPSTNSILRNLVHE